MGKRTSRNRKARSAGHHIQAVPATDTPAVPATAAARAATTAMTTTAMTTPCEGGRR